MNTDFLSVLVDSQNHGISETQIFIYLAMQLVSGQLPPRDSRTTSDSAGGRGVREAREEDQGYCSQPC